MGERLTQLFLKYKYIIFIVLSFTLILLTFAVLFVYQNNNTTTDINKIKAIQENTKVDESETIKGEGIVRTITPVPSEIVEEQKDKFDDEFKDEGPVIITEKPIETPTPTTSPIITSPIPTEGPSVTPTITPTVTITVTPTVVIEQNIVNAELNRQEIEQLEEEAFNRFVIQTDNEQQKAIYAPSNAQFEQTTQYLAGRVCALVIHTNDPKYDAFTEAEKESNVMVVEQGLEYFKEFEPNANLDFEVIPLDVSMEYANNNYYYLLNSARRDYGCHWAFYVDIHNYPGRAFARNIIGNYTRLFKSPYYTVLTHEVAHLFGADDNYDDPSIPYSNYPTDATGFLNIISGNNVSNNGLGYFDGSGEGQQDLMLNLAEIGVHTRNQIGWRDGDGDGILDVLDTYAVVDQTSVVTNVFGNSVLITGSAYDQPPLGAIKDPITINTIDSIQYKLNNGEWIDTISIDGNNKYYEEFQIKLLELPQGNYDIAIRAINSVGNVGKTYTYSFTINNENIKNAKPLARLDVVNQVKQGENVEITASASDFDSNSLRARFDFNGDGLWDSEFGNLSAEYNYELIGEYQIYAEITDEQENSDIISKRIIVSENGLSPEASFTMDVKKLSVDKYEISLDASESFSYRSNTEMQYQWDTDFDGITDYSSNSPLHSFVFTTNNPSKPLTIQLTVEDSSGLKSNAYRTKDIIIYNNAPEISSISSESVNNKEISAIIESINLPNYYEDVIVGEEYIWVMVKDPSENLKFSLHKFDLELVELHKEIIEFSCEYLERESKNNKMYFFCDNKVHIYEFGKESLEIQVIDGNNYGFNNMNAEMYISDKTLTFKHFKQVQDEELNWVWKQALDVFSINSDQEYSYVNTIVLDQLNMFKFVKDSVIFNTDSSEDLISYSQLDLITGEINEILGDTDALQLVNLMADSQGVIYDISSERITSFKIIDNTLVSIHTNAIDINGSIYNVYFNESSPEEATLSITYYSYIDWKSYTDIFLINNGVIHNQNLGIEGTIIGLNGDNSYYLTRNSEDFVISLHKSILKEVAIVEIDFEDINSIYAWNGWMMYSLDEGNQGNWTKAFKSVNNNQKLVLTLSKPGAYKLQIRDGFYFADEIVFEIDSDMNLIQ